MYIVTKLNERVELDVFGYIANYNVNWLVYLFGRKSFLCNLHYEEVYDKIIYTINFMYIENYKVNS